MILFSPSLLTLIILEAILLILGFVALLASVRIALDFNPLKTTAYQYSLNKKSYLVATIIMFILALKIPLFFFFVWALDATSLLLSGAMCAAGVVGATKWGSWMFFVKILTLFSLCAWIILHRLDLKRVDYKYTKIKFFLFQGLFFLLSVEFLLQLAHFSEIPIDSPVVCCSVLFDQSTSMGNTFSQTILLGLFCATFIFLAISWYLKHAWLFFIASFTWFFISILSLIQFFSPYIYELPTHKCPFCILQPEYFYIGYLIYALMFLGGIGAIGALINNLAKEKNSQMWYNFGFTCNTLLFLVLISFPLKYYLQNGVWL
jgi:hypothetical protein